MGKRVHVAKTYKVEFGDVSAFNWKHETFYDLLLALGGEPNWVGSEDDPTDTFECTTEDYDDAVQNLEVYIDNSKLIEDSEDVAEYLKQLGMTAEQVLKVMKAYQREADTSDGYLHFAAW